MFVTRAGDARLFVVEQNGITASLTTRVQCCGEEGLLGLAFKPNPATTGWALVQTTTYTPAVGDGGGGGDPFCAAHDPADRRGKILRPNVVFRDESAGVAAGVAP
ncbi:MAG: hypothetical protein D6709_03035 [Chloroflexi bacterium]|uniref:Uncharacterized protein n=1 Tax=Candidatus Thermofonsia Clade 3 bacterium TaxID=2364212 RepID=A0A2M8QDT7_9CHLR|nr:hypothetical protein [Candidatus Roseilinea sp. NK_OTU-006]PJF47973.1 MAG: hypothetical protein CUN48_05865 [Candidatus Thermofonsia Clade 3 bacterium]RMG65300.1 MAG: hypothetical protein D6709_03035 [Chloroflexota bacterium]